MEFDKLMACYNAFAEENRQTYDELLKCVRQGNLVPFFGAGISYWAYPGWKTTLTKFAEDFPCKTEVNELLAENKYEDAASVIERARGKKAFPENMVALFSPDKMDKPSKKRPEYLNYIPQIFHGTIITTNFDRCIERVFEDNNRPVPERVIPQEHFQLQQIEELIRLQKPLLVKMHGDVYDQAHLVFTKEAYDKTYGEDVVDFDKPIPHILKLLLNRSPLLFLGCSLNMDRTCNVIRNCNNKQNHSTHFAIMELPKETENTENPFQPKWRDPEKGMKPEFKKRRDFLVQQQGIKVIWYPYGMHEDALNAFFEKLFQDLGLHTPQESPISSISNNPLGCVNIWTPAQNDDRNACKLEAIRNSNSLCLMAETGYSFLAPTAQFRSYIDRFLSNRGTVHVLLNTAKTKHPFLTEDQKRYINIKRDMALKGYRYLKQRFGDQIILKQISYYLPAAILITNRYCFFEPYIQDEEKRQQTGFDTFEMMIDKDVSEDGYHTMLNYFNHLFAFGTEYVKSYKSRGN